MKSRFILASAAAAILGLFAFQAGAQVPVHAGPASDVESLAGAKHKETVNIPERKGPGAQAQEHRSPAGDTDSLAGQKHAGPGTRIPARGGSGAGASEHRGPISDVESLAGAVHRAR